MLQQSNRVDATIRVGIESSGGRVGFDALRFAESGSFPVLSGKLESVDFSPDAMGEWMPRDASKVPDQRLATLPTASSGASVVRTS